MKLAPLLIGGILGLAAGAASAMVMAGMVGSGVRLSGDVDVENWQSDWTIGSTAANPWTRARIARHGLLALTKEAAESDADAWSFTVSPARPAEGGWVSSRTADKFDLTLRLYKPSAALLSDPEATLPAPSVERLSCGGRGS